MAKLAETMDEGAITDWSFPLKGLIKGEALARYVRQQTGGKTIEQLPVPLGIVATNLHDGSGVLFRSGDLGLAVRASSAVPAVFQPVEIGARTFVDGGLVAPVPVRYARQMGAEVVIAIDISSPPDAEDQDRPVQHVDADGGHHGSQHQQPGAARGRGGAAPRPEWRGQQRLQPRASRPSQPAARRRKPCCRA